MFLLMYYGGFTYTEACNLPVAYRKWFIERINKEISKSHGGEGDNAQPQSRAMHENTPDANAMMGRNRLVAPSRMHRFS